jgi:hypothetical protein
MRKAIIVALAILLMAAVSHAGPFLRCDPQAGVESYIISEEGQTDIITPAHDDGSIKYDLASVTEGTHLWNVKACNVWGCSDSSPFGFTKSLPGQLQNVRIEGE